MSDSMGDSRKLYKTAVNTFGHGAQIEMAIEECAELIQALQKFKRRKPHNVAEEIADVEIMCKQLRIIFPGVTENKKARLIRLKELIDKRNTEAIS